MTYLPMKKKIYKELTDEEFVTELREILPNDPSETEIEIALNDFHSGMEIDSIVDHLIWGEWNIKQMKLVF